MILAGCSSDSVSFTVDGELFHETVIKDGTVKDHPGTPEMNERIFLGWFLGGERWSADTRLPANAELRAEWLELSLSEDGAFYTVTGVSDGFSGELSIPSDHAGKPIQAIADRAFYNNVGVTSVAIPASIERIGEGAFAMCEGLTSIAVAESSSHFSSEDGALYDAALELIIQYPAAKDTSTFALPDTVKVIGEYSFAKSGIEEIIIPESVELIESFAFYSCGELCEVGFAEGSALEEIGRSAFSSCTAIERIEIPNSTRRLGDLTFNGCYSLEEITFRTGSKLEEIGNYAFSQCEELTSIRYDGTLRKWNTRVILGEGGIPEKVKLINTSGTGEYYAPDGAWTPDEAHDGITVGVWASEDDYLAGRAPVKWYATGELLTEHIGTTDKDGLVFPDPDFIPGYVHLFADMTSSTSQLYVGESQKLVLNLGGNVLTCTAGFRIGGSDGTRPNASLTVKCGTLDCPAGQLQPRKDSTLIFDRAVFISGHADYVYYYAGSDLMLFRDSEFYSTSGSTFLFMSGYVSSGAEKNSFISEDSDFFFLGEQLTTMFRIRELKYGDCNWDIRFDADSSLSGTLKGLVTLMQEYRDEQLWDFQYTQTVTFEEGFSLFGSAELRDTYTRVTYDEETGDELGEVTLPANDDFCKIIY